MTVDAYMRHKEAAQLNRPGLASYFVSFIVARDAKELGFIAIIIIHV